MGPRILWVAAGLPLLAMLASAGAMHWGHEPETPPAPPAREHDAPGMRQAPAPQANEAQGFLGVIVAGESVDLTSTLEGRIESIRVQVGDRVSKGSIIATLDSQPLRRELEIAEAELLTARADEEGASYAEAEAIERLERRADPRQLRSGALSEEELAAARYQVRTATARLGSARARVRQHQARIKQMHQRLSEATLVAPFDAVVGRRYVDQGAVVSPGRPVVHLLRADDRCKVRFAIPEKQAPGTALGMRVGVEAVDHGVHLKGLILSLAPEVDAASRMIFGIAALEEAPGPSIPSGTVVRVSVLREVAVGKKRFGAVNPGAGSQ